MHRDIWILVAVLAGCTAGETSALLPTDGTFSQDGAAVPTLETTASVLEPEHAPVVIIGGGLSGLAVAAELPHGVLLEGLEQLGGRASMPGQRAFYLVDTPQQEALRIEDSVALALEQWEATTGGAASDVTETFLAETQAVETRLSELGVGLELATEIDRELLPRLHLTELDGTELPERFLAPIAEEVELRTGTWVQEVLVDEHGVKGVVANGRTILTDTVVVATGGYVGDGGLLAKVLTLELDHWEPAKDGFATGEAMVWAEQLGWGTAHISKVGWLMREVGLPDDTGSPIHIGTDPWILVDEQGRRFADESRGQSVRLAMEADARWPVWGVARWTDLLDAVLPEQRDALIEHHRVGSLVCADTLAVLADTVGVDGRGLQSTVDTVAAVARGERFDPFGRQRPATVYEDGELCAFPPGREASKSFGGLSVDAVGQVLDGLGTPIPGLFAVGEAAGMGAPGMGGEGGFDGSLSAVVWSGWRTGEYLASR